MNLVVSKQDKVYVQKALENGEIDYIEVASEGAETEFFQYLNNQGILKDLAGTYPFKRRNEEVTFFLYTASDLSFHGSLVIRTGGLLNALGPEVDKKVIHPDTGQVTIHCPGFNRKNKYDRQTPCDQDWLREIARATAAE
jgi:hypothetical protein